MSVANIYRTLRSIFFKFLDEIVEILTRRDTYDQEVNYKKY